MSVSQQLLKKNWVHLVASDAHSIKSRPPAMSTAHAAIKKRCGQETADRLCIDNPFRIFNGSALPEQPEAADIRPKRASSSRGLFSRIFQS